MALFSLLLSVVSIFVGGFRGCVLWLVGTVVLLPITGNYFLSHYHPRLFALLVCTVVLQLVSIYISRWWGLLFHIVGSFALSFLFMVGLI